MATKREELTYHTRLRAHPDERDILLRVQESFAGVGVNVSLNEVIRHLIRRAEIPTSPTKEDAQGAILRHWGECEQCGGERRPRCPDGVFLRREYQRLLGVRDGRAYVLQPVVSPDGMCRSGEGATTEVDESRNDLQRVTN
jgi:hypothetical protein